MYVSVGDSFPEGGMYNDRRVVCTMVALANTFTLFRKMINLRQHLWGLCATGGYQRQKSRWSRPYC